ncbi:MAG TPA: hypothetical protein VFG54_21045 [Prolixibacteraceae bacterium]|nr:hypothetical protein [Prolixibacteraceae bacterium]
MIVTKQVLAINLLSYLQHKTTLGDLVNWAEDAMMEGEIQGEDPEVVRDILARLGVADVKAFGLFLDDCYEFMLKLGYVLKIEAARVA